MIANGSSYLFVKTLGNRYGISDLFATRSQYLIGILLLPSGTEPRHLTEYFRQENIYQMPEVA